MWQRVEGEPSPRAFPTVARGAWHHRFIEERAGAQGVAVAQIRGGMGQRQDSVPTRPALGPELLRISEDVG